MATREDAFARPGSVVWLQHANGARHELKACGVVLGADQTATLSCKLDTEAPLGVRFAKRPQVFVDFTRDEKLIYRYRIAYAEARWQPPAPTPDPRMCLDDADRIVLRGVECVFAAEMLAAAQAEEGTSWAVMRMLDGVKSWKRVSIGERTRWTRHLSEAGFSCKATAEHEAAQAADYTPGSVVAVPVTAEMLAAAKAQGEYPAVPKNPEWVVKRTLDGRVSWAKRYGVDDVLWTPVRREASRMSELLAKGIAEGLARAINPFATVTAVPWEEAQAEPGGATLIGYEDAGGIFDPPQHTVLTDDMLVEACAAASWEASEAECRAKNKARGVASSRLRTWQEEDGLTQDFVRKHVRRLLGIDRTATTFADEAIDNAVCSVANALGWTPLAKAETSAPAVEPEPADWIVQAEWRGGPIYWHGLNKCWLTTRVGADRLTRERAERVAGQACQEGRPAKAVPWEEGPAEERAEAPTPAGGDWLLRSPDRQAYFARTSDTPGFVWVANPWMATSFTEDEADHAAEAIGGALTITHKKVALDGWPRPAQSTDWAVKSSTGKPYLVVTGRFSIEWDDDGARATKLTRAQAEDLAMRLNSERAERGLESVVWVVPWPGEIEAPPAVAAADYAVKSGGLYLATTDLLGTEWSSDRAQKMTLEEAAKAARRINVARANVGDRGVVDVVPWPNKAEG